MVFVQVDSKLGLLVDEYQLPPALLKNKFSSNNYFV
jgi:hypothetical protein